MTYLSTSVAVTLRSFPFFPITKENFENNTVPKKAGQLH